MKRKLSNVLTSELIGKCLSYNSVELQIVYVDAAHDSVTLVNSASAGAQMILFDGSVLTVTEEELGNMLHHTIDAAKADSIERELKYCADCEHEFSFHAESELSGNVPPHHCIAMNKDRTKFCGCLEFVETKGDKNVR